MSVDNVNDIEPRVQYEALAAQVEFDYTFPIFADADLVVDVDGVTLTLTTDYTVSGATADNGGTVTLVDALAGGEIVTIYRDVAIERTSDFQQNGPLRSSAMNDELDRITMWMQQLESRVERALRLSMVSSVDSADLELSPSSTWASKYLAFDANGKPEPADLVSSGTITQSIIAALLNPITPAESAALAVPVNYYKDAGYTIRYETNTTPGTTDMTAALNTAANVCREGNYVLYLTEETCLVTGSVDFSGITVRGTGAYNSNATPHIQASSAQFDVITSTGGTTLEDFYIHGGWDGATAGQTGDAISFSNGTGYAYNCHIKNVKVQYAKRNQIYWKHAGYGSIRSVKGNASGLHGLVLHGTDGAHQATTIQIDGFSTFSDTPNGYGADLYYTVSVGFNHVIMENTKGIRLNGTGHRALSFERVYQEGTDGGLFITDNASDGVGLTIKGCFGGNSALPYFTNWENVSISGNSNLTESAVPYGGRVIVADSNEQTTTTTGGVNFTGVTLSLPPGTWQIHATMQTIDASGASISQAGIQITNTVGASGLNNNTNVNFTEGCAAATSFGANKDARLNAFKVVRNTTSANVDTYVRGHVNISAGTLAYRVFAIAVRLQ